MTDSKIDKLRKLGYRVTTTQEFLELSDEEIALIDLKMSLVEKLKSTRLRKKLTQFQLAKLIGSSQSRVAALERGSPEASLDLICKALFALGIRRRELGEVITSKSAA